MLVPALRRPLAYLGRRLTSDHAISKLRQPDGQIVWHVTMPKSGSSWVVKVLASGLAERGWKKRIFFPTFGHREQEVDPRSMLLNDCLSGNVFCPHQHCPYSEYALKFIIQHRVRVILQVRDILDCLKSFIDHMDRESVVVPMAFMTPDQWDALEPHEKERFAVDLIAPWYIRFWAGWYQGLQDDRVDIKLVRYEDLLRRPTDVFESLADYCLDERIARDEVVRWVDQYGRDGTRMNRGIVGRGQELPAELKRRVHRYAGYYPETDFSAVGLDPSQGHAEKEFVAMPA